MAKLKKIEFIEKFYERNIDLDIDSNCHEVTSHCTCEKGYPIFSGVKRNGFYKIHRWVHWKNTGEIPEVVMHLCDNIKCINPLHLKSGTRKDNNLDKARKHRGNKFGGRGNNRGEKHGHAKLTDFRVWMIKGWLLEGYSCKDIALSFNVRGNNISGIKTNRYWKNIKFDLKGGDNLCPII